MCVRVCVCVSGLMDAGRVDECKWMRGEPGGGGGMWWSWVGEWKTSQVSE